jgi:hypothetical protein
MPVTHGGKAEAAGHCTDRAPACEPPSKADNKTMAAFFGDSNGVARSKVAFAWSGNFRRFVDRYDGSLVICPAFSRIACFMIVLRSCAIPSSVGAESRHRLLRR